MNSRLRVLVVDDSALMRKLIPQILERDQSIEVVGTAMDGSFGLKKLEELKPEVVTVDLDMPRMDGMEMLRQLTRTSRVPVIVVSAHSTAGADATFKALALGAVDFVTKPRNASVEEMEAIGADLIAKVKVAVKAKRPHVRVATEESRPVAPKLASRARKPATRVIAIGISTGGPNALEYLLSRLPGDFPAGILIVQHMPEGFTGAFARRLDQCCAIEVKEAASGDAIYAGRALVAPGNRHLKARRTPLGDVVVLSDEPRENGHRPSVAPLFRSVAREFGSDAIGVIMTGMGDDGAAALADIKSASGITIAQDELSSVVFGMPRAAIELGHAMHVVSLESLGDFLLQRCRGSQRSAEMVVASGGASLPRESLWNTRR